MIHSMTGFGRAEGQHDKVVYSVEARSVNSRHLKVHTRAADPLAFFESDVEAVVKRCLARGGVYVSIGCAAARDAAEYEFNMDALRSYHDALKTIHQQLGHPDRVPILELVNLPGVLQKATDIVGDTDQARARLTTLLEEALGSLSEMRRAEGANLKRDLEERCSRLAELLRQVEARTPQAAEAYRQRLAKRIAEMLKPMDIEVQSHEFYREMALFAERSNVAEEISRLKSHAQQLMASLDGDGPVGRKLEFIAQEMFREANTLGSKCNDTEMMQLALDVKGEIDNIREQICNVE